MLSVYGYTHISKKKQKKNMVNLEIDLAGINTVTSPKIFF